MAEEKPSLQVMASFRDYRGVVRFRKFKFSKGPVGGEVVMSSDGLTVPYAFDAEDLGDLLEKLLRPETGKGQEAQV